MTLIRDVLRYYGLAALPIFFGILTYLSIPLSYPWIVKGIIVFPLMIFLLGHEFVERNKISWGSYSISTVYPMIGIYFLICFPLCWMGNPYNIATALILSPIIEEFVARAFFCTVQLKNKWQLFFLVIVSAVSFSLMHWFFHSTLYSDFTWA